MPPFRRHLPALETVLVALVVVVLYIFVVFTVELDSNLAWGFPRGADSYW